MREHFLHHSSVVHTHAKAIRPLLSKKDISLPFFTFSELRKSAIIASYSSLLFTPKRIQLKKLASLALKSQNSFEIGINFKKKASFFHFLP